MDSGIRQAGIVAGLTAVVGAGLALWVSLYEPPPPPPRPPVAETAEAPLPPDPNAPFIPRVGQAGKDVVWVPTSSKLVNAMLDLARVTPADSLIDLGSGDGRTVITAARRGVRAVGVEFNPAMVELSLKQAALAGVENRVTFIQGDLFKQDLSRATVITMFLLPRLNLQLRPKLLELKPGTRIVSNSFDMGEWTPDAETTVQDDECQSWCTALLWIVPAKVDGTWQLPDGALILTQTFQKVTGTLAGTPIVDPALSGDRLSFMANGRTYTAQVSGDVMTATGGASWMARRESRPGPR